MAAFGVPTLEDLPPLEGRRVLLRADFNVPIQDGAITGFAANRFSVDTTAFSNPFNGSWSVAQTGNNLTLNYTAAAIPEPSTYAAIAGSIMLVVVAIRRKATRRAEA